MLTFGDRTLGIQQTLKPHPCEVMYVVVYWLHFYNPFSELLFVLCIVIMLSAKRQRFCKVGNG